MNRLRGLILIVLCLLLICFGSFLLAVEGEVFFKEGKKFFKKKQYVSAIEMFDAAIDTNSSYWEAMSWRIKTLGKQKEVSAQIDACYSMLEAMNKATDLSERDKKLKKKITRQVSKLDKEGAELRRMVKDYIEGAIKFANNAMEKKNYILARKIFRKIRKLDPENEIAKTALEKLRTLCEPVSLFDGKSVDGWYGFPKKQTPWNVVDGKLYANASETAGFICGNKTFSGQFELSGVSSMGRPNIDSGTADYCVGLLIGYGSSGDDCLLVMISDKDINLDWMRKAGPKRLQSKQFSEPLSFDEDFNFRILASALEVIIEINGVKVIQYKNSDQVSINGKLGVMARNTEAIFYDLKVIER